jgi:hypothetical protein
VHERSFLHECVGGTIALCPSLLWRNFLLALLQASIVEGMAEEGVQVAVRVRPFAGYEKDANANCCVRMDGAQTIVSDPETGKPKSFTFDYSYNSFVDKDDPGYASNDTVYNDLGHGVLENAWKGFNCCLFAYGQTGAGKSYSMMGYGEDKGIIPKAMTEMFQRIQKFKAEESPVEYRVNVSMLEIYAEKIRDLFSSTPPPKGGLKLRMHPKAGPYVANLSENAVDTYQQVEEWMERGSAARTVASTNMNATSSRAHTVFRVTFTQISEGASGKKTAKVSHINLIDLAGSERANATGATGDRLKEGAAINKSLSALGNVINALAKQSKEGKKSKVKVPYRDSALTQLLQTSLGGNSKTIMIAAISPADLNFKETISTLVYADRAKQIKNKAVVNEDPQEKLVRGMKEEIEQLRKMLAEQADTRRASVVHTPAPVVNATMSKEEQERTKQEWQANKDREMEEMRQEMEEKLKAVKESEQSWEERLREAEEKAAAQIKQLKEAGVAQGKEKEELKKKAKTIPHILNLNEDPLMNGVVLYLLNEGQTLIGRKDAEEKQDVELTGLSIEKEHAKVLNTGDGKVVIITNSQSAKVIINGERISDSHSLTHNDRIVIGNNHIFRYVCPQEADPSNEEEEVRLYDYAFAMREMNEKMMESLTAGERAARENAEREAKAMEAKMSSLQRNMELERARMLKEKEKQREIFLQQQKQMEEDLAMREENLLKAAQSEEERKQLEEEDATLRAKIKASKLEYERQKLEIEKRQTEMEEKMKQEIAVTAEEKRQKERQRRDRQKLDEQLISIIPKINEANAIAEELMKPMAFSIKLLAADMQSSPKRGSSRKKSVANILESNIGINVDFTDNRQPSVVWEIEKFDNRLYLMRDMYNSFADVYSRDLNALAGAYMPEQDPFWDPPEAQLVGKALIYMDSLSFLLEIEEGTPIIDFKGKQQGELTCEIVPLKLGAKSLVDDYEEHELEHYNGQFLEIEVRMVGAKGIPHMLSNNVFLRYQFYNCRPMDVPPAEGKSMAPNFHFTDQLQIEVNDDFIEYVKNEAFEIEVWGSPDEVVYSANTGGRSKDSEYGNMTAQQLVDALEKEKKQRKQAETRLAEIEMRKSSREKEELVEEIERLKKQLSEAKKSQACNLQ